jgi:hypothetical protein
MYIFQFTLGPGMPLLGGKTEQFGGFGRILGHAFSLGVHPGEAILGLGMALIGGIGIPGGCIGIILGYA